jgi:hypothetical protein
MRILAIVPFGALSILMLAATCIANVEQKGPEGPWVGEIVNAGDEPVNHVYVIPRIYDSTGREIFGAGGSSPGDSCPSTLLPGERGAFEVFFERPRDGQAEPLPPLRAEFPPGAIDFPDAAGPTGDGLLAELVAEVPDQRLVRVRITNNSNHPYSDLTVCGVLRAQDGRLAEVGRASGPTPAGDLYASDNATIVYPGDAIDLDLFFNTMPEGSVRLFPSGNWRDPPLPCCTPGPLPRERFSVKNPSFSVLLPPGWTYEPLQGIDSFVGRYYGGGMELLFDYGIYSDPLNYDADPAYDVHEETIGGLTAKIVRPNGPQGITGVHVAFVKSFEFPADNIPFDVRLTITGQDLTLEQQEIVLQIFRSIRFAE